MKLHSQYDLSQRNTLGLPAVAENFARASSVHELKQLLSKAREQLWPVTILGGGSNVVLDDVVPGLVIQPELRGIQTLGKSSKHVYIRVAAGENWHELVKYALNAGWYGLENLALIPGWAGAAPIQNIGAYGVEIAQFIDSVEYLSLRDGSYHRLSTDECDFGYRHSIFKTDLKGQAVITAINLRLNVEPAVHCEYPALKLYMDAQNLKMTPENVFQAVVAVRQSKLPDPAQLPNAGSFFKNPLVWASKYEMLKKQYPDMPAYDNGDGRFKLAAGWMIEQAGWKGKRLGALGMHSKQALVLVNYGGANADELWALAEQVRNSVFNQFGVQLEAEPVSLPCRHEVDSCTPQQACG